MIHLDNFEHEWGVCNNEKGKYLYMQIAWIFNNGLTGLGVRIRLPTCVEAGVHSLFLDRMGNHIGFRKI